MLRNFHTSSVCQAIKPYSKPHSAREGVRSFEKNFETRERRSDQKIWDQRGISKDEFFSRKYGNIKPEDRKRLDEKVARQRRMREARKQHERGDDFYQKPAPPKFTLNPLCEYVYGTHPVIAALSSGKRGAFNRLFIFNPKEQTSRILQLAKKFGVKVEEKNSKGEMNMISSNGVHNGVVLETKPLPFPSIEEVGPCDSETGEYSISLYDGLSNTTTSSTMTVARTTPEKHAKYPLGIYLDGITDPHNVGNIVRSAFYMGVDFIVLPDHDSARLGPVAAKTSVGALDLMTIYKTEDSLGFVDLARRNGWNVISTSTKPTEVELTEMKKHGEHLKDKFIEVADLPGLMDLAPVILVFGSEGAGIRTNLKFRSDYLVGLEKGRQGDDIVDSLNVGVAAGLLISKCLE